jgi:hypothetical protein
LYLYSIKIQTDIDHNAVKNIRENHKKKFEKIFLELFFGLDPAGFYPQTCVNNSHTPATVMV